MLIKVILEQLRNDVHSMYCLDDIMHDHANFTHWWDAMDMETDNVTATPNFFIASMLIQIFWESIDMKQEVGMEKSTDGH